VLFCLEKKAIPHPSAGRGARWMNF
jgi:hypothetical protein